MVQVVLAIDRILPVGGEVHCVDEGNTPFVTFLLFGLAGYRLDQKVFVEGAKSFDDNMLLSFSKVHEDPRSREALSRISYGLIPRYITAVSPIPYVLEEQRYTVAEQLERIPTPPAPSVIPLPAGPIQPTQDYMQSYL